jgi:hypothetical protein
MRLVECVEEEIIEEYYERKLLRSLKSSCPELTEGDKFCMNYGPNVYGGSSLLHDIYLNVFNFSPFPEN